MDIEIFEARLKKKKKTQTEMAQELGMNICRISDMKKGRLDGWKYRRRMSKYLGIPEDKLFPDNGDNI